ncbi:hypothetical protein [Aurantiacibacter gilvus]|uniref:Uncharacterized protein n=1 Tax=Aurantiacibacter gilvus TaxID=3139141 RepID=A0ABU9IBM7_9SPHN
MGADLPLVLDALVVAAIALAGGVGATALYLRRRRSQTPSGPDVTKNNSQLEERVRVLERIATDRSLGLAEEIDSLRELEKAD